MWSTENIRFCEKYIEKQPKTSKNSLFSAVFWSKWQDSNLRSHRPERCAIPPSLHLEMVKLLDFFVSGQTCGQTEELMIFRHSGEPKKSVFSRVFGSSRKFYAERGDWDPKLARYHLRYASKRKKLLNFVVVSYVVNPEIWPIFRSGWSAKSLVFSRGFGIFAVAWLNKRPQVPEPSALPTALHLVVLSFKFNANKTLRIRAPVRAWTTPSHSRRASLDTLTPSARCFGLSLLKTVINCF